MQEKAAAGRCWALRLLGKGTIQNVGASSQDDSAQLGSASGQIGKLSLEFQSQQGTHAAEDYVTVH